MATRTRLGPPKGKRCPMCAVPIGGIVWFHRPDRLTAAKCGVERLVRLPEIYRKGARPSTSRLSGTGYDCRGCFWPQLCRIRICALCLRRFHRQHGAYLATWSVGIRLLHWARSRRGWNWHYCRNSPSFSGHTRSAHDELVWPCGLGAEPVRATPPRMGNTAPKSMVRVCCHPVVSRLRADCRRFFAKPCLEPRFGFARVNRHGVRAPCFDRLGSTPGRQKSEFLAGGPCSRMRSYFLAPNCGV
jgi:hypothetical protein